MQVRDSGSVDTSACAAGDAESSPASASIRDSALGYWLPIATSSRIGVSAICAKVERQVQQLRAWSQGHDQVVESIDRRSCARAWQLSVMRPNTNNSSEHCNSDQCKLRMRLGRTLQLWPLRMQALHTCFCELRDRWRALEEAQHLLPRQPRRRHAFMHRHRHAAVLFAQPIRHHLQ